MSRAVRMVPPDWKHPVIGTYPNGKINYRALESGAFSQRLADWNEEFSHWESGEVADWSSPGAWKPKDADHAGMSFAEWHGEMPVAEDFMPEWPASEATHFMMYETTSEGTPISPAFATPEELAMWLVDNGASAFADQTASYGHWLRIARGGWAPSAILDDKGFRSGVTAMGELP
jgi:hypothetical protein